MKNKVSLISGIGLVIFAVYMIVDKLIIQLPDLLGVSAMVISIVLILAGGMKGKKQNN